MGNPGVVVLRDALRWLRAVGVTLVLPSAVYVPTFALVSALHLTMAHAIPIIITVSTVFALVLMLVLRGCRKVALADFGLRGASWKYLAVALLIAVPSAAIVDGLLSRAHEPGGAEAGAVAA